MNRDDLIVRKNERLKCMADSALNTALNYYSQFNFGSEKNKEETKNLIEKYYLNDKISFHCTPNAVAVSSIYCVMKKNDIGALNHFIDVLKINVKNLKNCLDDLAKS